MEERIITFTANEQGLVKTGGISHYASDTISYIKAVFTLGENWQGFDEVRAVFKSPYVCKNAVLDSNGECYVPVEVLFYKGKVRVNLVGSIVTETEITDRLTTYSVEALDVDEDVPICGEESQPISPSEYEQFVAKVANDANRAEQSATDAETYADEAEASAQNASESATASANSASDSAQSATASAQSAQNASESAQSAENAKDDAEDARDEILGMRATAETLEAGSDATASYSDGLLTLGIPRGDRGEQGIQGETGATPNLTIGTVETLAPTEDATATITGTAEEPVLNLGLPKGDTGEVSLEDLESLLPTDTASGEIVTITDGQAIVPAKSLKVALEPIQDLHGYDKPWAGGNGKNLCPPIQSTLFRGVTTTTNEIGVTTVSGTAESGGGRLVLCSAPFTLQAGTYTFSHNGTGTWGDVLTVSVDGGAAIADCRNAVSYASFTLNSATTVVVGISVTGRVSYNGTVSPQLEKGSTATSWTPYSNICPISGHTECVTSVSGVNVWDEEWEIGSYSSTGQKVPASGGRIRSVNKISVLPNTSYYALKGVYILCQYDKNEDFISFTQLGVDSPSNTNHLFTTGEKTRYITFATHANYGTTYNHDISINYPSTDTSYHAHDGNTYTTALGRTVYGGTLDVVSGELTLTHGVAVFDGSDDENWIRFSSGSASAYAMRIESADFNIKVSASTQVTAVANYLVGIGASATWGNYDGFVATTSSYPNNIFTGIKSITTVADWKAYLAENPLQVVYELATPQTYQLTPQEVRLLLGTNNVWSDGNVTLVYSADIQRWVEKKLNGNSTTLTMSRPMVQTETETEAEETAETETE